MARKVPFGVHRPDDRVRLYKVGNGAGKTRRIKVWHKGRLKGPHGVDCGPYYFILKWPVGPRIHDGRGFQPGSDHTFDNDRYEPVMAYELGHRPMNEIPEDWREVNAKAEAKRAEMERKRTRDPAHMEVLQGMRDTVQDLADAMRQGVKRGKTGGKADA